MPHLDGISRRALLRGAAAAGAVALAGCATRPSAPATARARSRLRLLGEATLPHHLKIQGTIVGGLSGLDFDPATGLWVAISDDRSELSPARFYTLRIEVQEGSLAVQVRDAITLRGANGQPFPRRADGGEVVDPEAIRLLPRGGGVLWTSEGDLRAGQQPALRASRLDGTFLREFQVPATLRYDGRPGTGARSNLTFEGLALTPDAGTAWVAMEAALQQDGPVPGVGRPGAPCRFTAFDVASGRAVRQIAYVPDAIPHAPLLPGGLAENGVSEILMADADRMLVLERAFSVGRGTSMRVYEIDPREGSDTLDLPQLQAGEFQAVSKRLVADFAQLGLSRLDNTEGMSWGPRLPNGHRTLVFVSDDNFSAAQVTQFAAFEYLESP